MNILHPNNTGISRLTFPDHLFSNSKKGANAFCAATETLAQETNDAHKMGQAFL